MKPSVRLILIGLIAVLPAAAILGYEAATPALPAAIVLGALAAAALAWAAHRLLNDSDAPALDAEAASRERELLRAKHAAEAASRAKTEFLAVVSHEVRTPLNAVIGFSEMLREGYAGPVDAKQREYLDDILVSARHLLRLMGDMLDMSAIEAGRIAVRPMLLPLRAEIEASAALVRTRAAEAELRLVVEVAPDVPPLWGDRTRFRQIALNLLSNAIKFTPPGGTVAIRAESRGEEIVVAVSDTGIGMCEADIPRALEPFRQIDNAMSRQYEGVGLGLPLAKNLTELQGGRLELTSRLGRGTTVTLYFPRAPAAALARAPTQVHSYG